MKGIDKSRTSLTESEYKVINTLHFIRTYRKSIRNTRNVIFTITVEEDMVYNGDNGFTITSKLFTMLDNGKRTPIIITLNNYFIRSKSDILLFEKLIKNIYKTNNCSYDL